MGSLQTLSVMIILCHQLIHGLKLRYPIPPDLPDRLVESFNGNHGIFLHINIVKFCDELQTLKKGHYVHNIHLSDDLYNPIRENTVKNANGRIPVPILMRNCQLLSYKDNREYKIFVTSFPATKDYAGIITGNTILVLECSFSECEIVAMAISDDFEQEFPISDIEMAPDISDVDLVKSIMARTNRIGRKPPSIYANIDMRILCGDIQLKFRTLYTKDLSSTDTNSYVRHTIRLDSMKKKRFMAKRCALTKNNAGETKEIFVTELLKSFKNTDKIILFACSKKDIRTIACEFERAIWMPISKDYYPDGKIIFDVTPGRTVELGTKKELPNQNNFQKLTMRNLCTTIRLSSKGFFVQNINPTKERYTVQTVSLRETKSLPDMNLQSNSTTSKNETLTNVQARNCQLLKASDSSKQIYLTEWQMKKSVFVILECVLKECRTESFIYVDEGFAEGLIAKTLPRKQLHAKYKDEVLQNLASDPYTPHRILENIDMFSFCQILVQIKFRDSYKAVSKPSFQQYEIVQDNRLYLEETQGSILVSSRSCQIHKENNMSQEIFVAPSSAASIHDDDEEYQAKDTVAVLACTGGRCTLEGTLEVPNLEDNFPALDMITDNSQNRSLMNTLPPTINSYHRIFQNINMFEFCNKLEQLSEGLYVQSETTIHDRYGIHNKNRIGGKPIFSRSCQLRRVDNTMVEIFVAAPLFADDYMYFRDIVILLRCENGDCRIETSANFHRLQEKYDILRTGPRHYDDVYEQAVNNLPGLTFIFSVLKEKYMTAVCEKIKEYFNGLYEADNDPLNNHRLIPHFSTLIINSLQVNVTVAVCGCPLAKMQDQRKTIKLTTMPEAYTPPSLSVNETPVIILECRHNEKCYFRSTLVIRNASTAIPEIVKSDDGRALIIDIPYLSYSDQMEPESTINMEADDQETMSQEDVEKDTGNQKGLQLNYSVPSNLLETLIDFPNGKHSIFEHINIVKFCDDLRTQAKGLYVHNIHLSKDVYNITERNKIKNENIIISPKIPMRNCQLLKFENNYTYEIFVTAFPDTLQYMDISAVDTTLVLECWSSECEIVAMAVVPNFAQTVLVDAITLISHENAVNLLNAVPISNTYLTHSVFANIDMRVVCGDIRDYVNKEKLGLYIEDSELPNKNSCTPHRATWKLNNKQFIAKRCPLVKVEKGVVENKMIFVTALRMKKYNSAPIIIVACLFASKRGKIPNCEFENALSMPFTLNYYPNEDITFDVALSRCPKKGVRNKKILRTFNTRKLCRTLRIASKGYFVQNINLSNERFALQTLQLPGNAGDIEARSCQLLKASDLTQQIFITEQAERSTSMTILACRQQDQCWIESFTNIDEPLFKKYSAELLPHIRHFSEDISDEVLKNTALNPYTPHRILENIDMLRFCLMLMETEFDKSYHLVSNPILQKFDATKENFLNLKETVPTISVTSRSCQMLKDDNEFRGIFVAPSSAAKINGAEPLYEARNTVVVLSCLNEICTLKGTIEVPNLEDNFPILDMMTDNTLYENVPDSLVYSINAYHRIFMNINMMEFCAHLEDLSEGLYVRSRLSTEDRYDIHDKNRIRGTPIFSRSCQLRSVQNNLREVVLAAPLFHNEYSHSKDTIFILSCLNRDCKLETTAIFFNFEAKYPHTYTEYQYYNGNYETNVLDRLPGMYLDSSFFQEDQIGALCNQIKVNTNGRYTDLPLSEDYDFPLDYITLIISEPYTEANVLVRSCPLIVAHDEHNAHIKITTPPTPNWNPAAKNVTSVAILECEPSDNTCKYNSTLVIKDLVSENPEFMDSYVQTTLINTITSDASSSSNIRVTGKKRPHDAPYADQNKRLNTGFAINNTEQEQYFPHPASEDDRASVPLQQIVTPAIYPASDQMYGPAYSHPQEASTSAQPAAEMRSDEALPLGSNCWSNLISSVSGVEKNTHAENLDYDRYASFLQSYIECTDIEPNAASLSNNDNADANNAVLEESDTEDLDDERFDQWLEANLGVSPQRMQSLPSASNIQQRSESQLRGRTANDGRDDP